MADRSKIEWCDASWNFLAAYEKKSGKRGWFCSHVHAGCANCYAESRNLNTFFGNGIAYKAQNRDRITWEVAPALTKPLSWRKPRRIFVNSMFDIMEPSIPRDMLDHGFALMAMAFRHTFLLLTKHPTKLREYISDPSLPFRLARICTDMFLDGDVKPDAQWPVKTVGDTDMPDDITLEHWPLPNLWIGTSPCDQATADRDIPELMQIPAAKRFLSIEPLLGPVDLNRIHETYDSGLVHSWESCLNGKRFDPWSDGSVSGYPKIDWVIAGGESGDYSRPAHPEWFFSLRDQCQAAGVPFFFKQWGEWTPGVNVDLRTGVVDTATWFDGEWSMSTENLAFEDGHIDDEPCLYRVGKKSAGRLLDGRTWDEFPKVGA